MPITQFPAKGQVMRVESVLKTISTVHGDPPSDYILTAVRTTVRSQYCAEQAMTTVDKGGFRVVPSSFPA